MIAGKAAAQKEQGEPATFAICLSQASSFPGGSRYFVPWWSVRGLAGNAAECSRRRRNLLLPRAVFCS